MREHILELTISVEELVKQLGGTGHGLHSKTNSISHLLDPKYERKLHMIATVRNKAMHENILPTNIHAFERAVADTKVYLLGLYLRQENPKQSEPKESNKRKLEWSEMNKKQRIYYGIGIAIGCIAIGVFGITGPKR
ncbi:hypothetical protein ACKWOP_16375 [Escherichia coli]|uniref:hypothetical protein n=1 Tax=Escherichia coli TaxID=562 RepID=UPI003904DCD3